MRRPSRWRAATGTLLGRLHVRAEGHAEGVDGRLHVADVAVQALRVEQRDGGLERGEVGVGGGVHAASVAPFVSFAPLTAAGQNLP